MKVTLQLLTQEPFSVNKCSFKLFLRRELSPRKERDYLVNKQRRFADLFKKKMSLLFRNGKNLLRLSLRLKTGHVASHVPGSVISSGIQDVYLFTRPYLKSASILS